MHEHHLEKVYTLGSDRNQTKKVLVAVLCSCGEEKVFSMPDMIQENQLDEEKVYYSGQKIHEHFIDKAYEEVKK